MQGKRKYSGKKYERYLSISLLLLQMAENGTKQKDEVISVDMLSNRGLSLFSSTIFLSPFAVMQQRALQVINDNEPIEIINMKRKEQKEKSDKMI